MHPKQLLFDHRTQSMAMCMQIIQHNLIQVEIQLLSKRKPGTQVSENS